MDDGISSPSLGFKHEPVGPVDDTLQRILRRHRRNAYGHGNMESAFIFLHRCLGYDFLEAGRNGEDVLLILDGINTDEFLAAPAADGIGFPCMAENGFGEGFQDFIPRLMAVFFVEFMEMVDVREKHRKGLVEPVILGEAGFSTASRKIRFGSLVRAS